MIALTYTVDRIEDGILTLLCRTDEDLCAEISAECLCNQQVREGDVVLVIWHQEIGGPCTIKVMTQQSKNQKHKAAKILSKIKSNKK